jgi:hypothetical protein
LLWSDLPDAERVPYDGPWGWWSDADVDALEAVLDEWAAPNDEHVAEALRRGRADRQAADARQAELDALRSEALDAARQEAKRISDGMRPPDRSTPTLEEAIGAEIAKAIRPAVAKKLVERNRRQRSDPLGNPIKPRRPRRR